jgi:hypothetical protein
MLKTVLQDTFDLLTFRISRERILAFGKYHLIFGLISTWIVGMGRYWDNPRVEILQHLGIGSVIYIFVLAFFLWVIVLPLKPKDWMYFRVLTFISLVSPPAILYAIPVEMVFGLDVSNSINAFYLLIVSVWRVSLLVFFFKRLARLNWFEIIVTTLLPLILIINTLVYLNLERVVFNFMGGFREPSGNDAAYQVLWLVSLLSIILFLPVLIAYIVVAVYKYTLPESNR